MATAESARDCLLVVQAPDLVVELVCGDERSKALVVNPPVGVEHSLDASRISPAGLKAHHTTGHVPVNWPAEGVFEVVPDQTVRRAQQVAERHVAMQRLHR